MIPEARLPSGVWLAWGEQGNFWGFILVLLFKSSPLQPQGHVLQVPRVREMYNTERPRPASQEASESTLSHRRTGAGGGAGPVCAAQLPLLWRAMRVESARHKETTLASTENSSGGQKLPEGGWGSQGPGPRDSAW